MTDTVTAFHTEPVGSIFCSFWLISI